MSNWFTTQHLASDNVEKRIAVAGKLEGECEHVAAHPEILYAVSRENDSFGVVGEYGMCQACYRKQQEEVAGETVVCHDCHAQLPKRDTITWRWYDFYAPQGDEPMTICNECVDKPTHRRRVAKDNDDYNEEMSR